MTTPELNASHKPRSWTGALVVFLVTLAVFWPVVQGDFLQWDDDINITQNPHIQKLNRDNLAWMLTDSSYVRRYIPLTWLSFAVNNACLGLTSSSYHAGNLIFHACNAVLVYLLILKFLLLATGRLNDAIKFPWLVLSATLGALCWALNPMRVEVVAWASGRIYCQANFLLLLSLWSYFAYFTAAAGMRRRGFYCLSVLACAASLLTYPLALALPLLLVIADYYLLKRFSGAGAALWHGDARRVWLEKLPFFFLVGVVFALTLWARVSVQGDWHKPATLAEFGVGSRVMQAFYIWAHFLWRPWWTVDLAPVYTILINFDPHAWPFCLSAAAILTLSLVLLWRRQHYPLIWALWLGYLVYLVPVLGLTEHPHYPNDRYGYFVGIFWPILMAFGLLKIGSKSRLQNPVLVGCTGLVLLLGSLSFRQIHAWQNTATLMRHTIATLGDDPYRSNLWYRLGMFYRGEGQLQAAQQAFESAIEISPQKATLHTYLADVYDAQQNLAKASRHYAIALELDPKNFNAHQNLGILLAKSGKLDEAIVHFRQAVKLSPRNAEAHQNLAVALTQKGELDEAKIHQAEARKIAAENSPNEHKP